MKITIVTSNPKKAEEASRIINGAEFEIRSLEIPEIQSYSLEEIVRNKAQAAFVLVGKPVIVQDAAFDISALGGFPGPFVKFWLENVGYDRAAEIAMKMGDQRGILRCGIGYCDGDQIIYVEKEVSGKVVPKSGEGYGFYAYFAPDGQSQTFAEMGTENKNDILPYFKAMVQMREKLTVVGILER